MSDDMTNPFGSLATKDESSSSSKTRQTKEYKPYDEEVARMLIDALGANGGDITMALREDNADPIPDAVLEQYDLPEGVTHFAIEQIAPFSIEAEYVGTPVNVTYEQLEESVEAGVTTWEDIEEQIGEEPEPGETYKWAPEGTESTPQSDLSTILNGFFSDEITAKFGDGAKVRVMTALRDSVPAAHHRYNNIRFYVSNSAKAPLQRQRARVVVGQLTESELQDWADENGFADDISS